MGQAEGVNITVPESTHKHPTFPAMHSETQETEASFRWRGVGEVGVDQLPYEKFGH